MATRMVNDGIYTSKNLNRLSIAAERHFYRLLPLPDDYGCFKATPEVIRGRCYPLQLDPPEFNQTHQQVTVKDIVDWQTELERQDVILFWTDGEHKYGIYVTWDKHQRTRGVFRRRTPPPPDDIARRVADIRGQTPTSAADVCSHPPSPIPHPPSPLGEGAQVLARLFFDHMKQNHPGHPVLRGLKVAELNDTQRDELLAKWAVDFEFIMRNDNRTVDDLKRVVEWVRRDVTPRPWGKDSWHGWGSVIQSPRGNKTLGGLRNPRLWEQFAAGPAGQENSDADARAVAEKRQEQQYENERAKCQQEHDEKVRADCGTRAYARCLKCERFKKG